MKKILLCGAALAVVIAAAPAQAQQAYAKNNENILGSATYAEPEPERQAQADTEDLLDAEAETVTRYEPAAGDEGGDFTGPYIGADIGYNFGGADINNPAGPDGDEDLEDWEGGVFAGYGMADLFGWFGYAGIELGYDWSGAEETLGGFSYEKDEAFKATFRPGVAMDQALGYAILGYSRASFESNLGDDDFDGFIIGAGAQFDTATPLKLRLEYAYTNYEEGNLGPVDFEPHDSALKAGAVFQF